MKSKSKVELAVENVMVFNWIRSLVIRRNASDMSYIRCLEKTHNG